MSKHYWIGIDLGGTNIRVGLLDEAGRILDEKKERTEAELGHSYIVEKLIHMINNVKNRQPLQGIGIGMPGPLDPRQGIVLGPVNLPGWTRVPLAQTMVKHFEVPCFIDNDCNVAALAEALAGAGKRYPIVFYITVSTGIGGGLCINGEIHNGATGNAGEIANIMVRENSARHSFLNPGSLEGSASGTCILRMAREKGLAVGHTREVFDLAAKDDPTAVEIIEYAVDSLARGMAAIAHVIDPHIFVLGGGVSVSVPGFIPMVRDRFEQYIYQVMRGRIRVEPAQLRDPGIIGAMYMAKNRMEKEKP